MTDYTYKNGDIMNGNLIVGWLSLKINHQFLCMLELKKVLESKTHTFDVNIFIKKQEVIPTAPYLRIVEGGIYITDHEDEINYAFISNDMNSTKLCAKAVLEVMVV